MPSQKRAAVDFVCNPCATPETMEPGLARVVAGRSERLADLLVLRGMLAGGLLAHCLSRRPSVDFGVPKGRSKSLAVPYVAADTPHPRSEFAQPDKVRGRGCLRHDS